MVLAEIILTEDIEEEPEIWELPYNVVAVHVTWLVQEVVSVGLIIIAPPFSRERPSRPPSTVPPRCQSYD